MTMKIDIKKSNKTQITKSEYLQLIGLKTVSKTYWDMIEGLGKAAQKITGEIDYDGRTEFYGHTSDFLAGDRDLDEMLRILNLEVVEDQ